MAIYQAAPSAPPAPAPLTQLEFMRCFTQTERIAIKTAEAASPELADKMELMRAAQEVRLDDPDTVEGVQMLETLELIAPGRAAEILGE